MDALDGAYLKLERGEAHLAVLREGVSAFLRTLDPAATGKLEEEGVPTEWSILLGDAIHNARCALDYLVWELASLSLAGQRPPSPATQFPIATRPESFVRLADQKLADLNTHDISLIRVVQPYHSEVPEDHPLRVLQRLSNQDKHRRINLLLVEESYLFNEPGTLDDTLGWSMRLIPERRTDVIQAGRKVRLPGIVSLVVDNLILHQAVDEIIPTVSEVLQLFGPRFAKQH